MKRRNIYFILGLALLTGGCQKLDRELITDLNQAQVEASFNNVQALLNGVYSETREGFTEIGGEAMKASATDEAEFTNELSSVQLFNQGAWNAINNPAGIWNPMYGGIRRANIFLETADTNKVNLDIFRPDPTTFALRRSEVTRFRNEARFLRAFFYFELVKRYGGVPLITSSAVGTADVPIMQRSTLQQCVDFIRTECDTAALGLPLTYGGGDLGRATRGAALALKARLLLYAASELFNNPSWAGGSVNAALISLPGGDRTARWQEAANAAKAVIDLGAGYALAPSYQALFTSFNSPEIIYTRRNAATNTFERINAPISMEGRSGNTPTQDLVDAYEVRTRANPNVSVPFDWSNPIHADSPYVRRDPRLALTVVFNASTTLPVAGVTRVSGTPPVATGIEIWNGGRDAKPLPFATKTGYYLRKYVNGSVNLLNNTTAVHSWIHFRLAEVFLNYAEALNEAQPGNPDIKRFYDSVRSRPGIVMPRLPTGLTQDEVRQRLRNERRVELAFEDHRAWDVRRWMIAPATLGAPIRGVDINRTSTTPLTYKYTPFVLEPRVFEPKMYLYPIPQNEIAISPLLKQNPMW